MQSWIGGSEGDDRERAEVRHKMEEEGCKYVGEVGGGFVNKHMGSGLGWKAGITAGLVLHSSFL